MKRNFLLVAAISGCLIFQAQDPLLDSWMFNDGTLASYQYYPNPMNPTNAQTTQTADAADVTQVCYDNNHVYVESEGLASYVMGPWNGNPNTPSAQGFIWKVTRNPQQETGTATAQPVTGPLGVSINGIAFYGTGDARSYNPSTGVNDGQGQNVWHGDAWVSEGATMDASGNGHPQQQGQYHYHACPSSLYSDPSTSHSPIIGWAFDGYPIYGPFGYSDPMNTSSGITRMSSGYALRTSMSDRTTLPDGTVLTNPNDYGPAITNGGNFDLGTYWEDYKWDVANGTLDDHNGRFCKTPEYPNGIYAYFIATDANGDPAYPYLIGETYYGIVSTSDIQTGAHATIPLTGISCKDGSTPTSVKENGVVGITIYPNPASSSVTIMTNNVAGEISVISFDGKLVSSWQPTSTSNQVDLSEYADGIYVVKIINNDQVSTHTMIVNK